MNNFLTNNVLTSKITSDLWNKVRVRYYDHENNTTPLTFTNVLLADSELSAGPFTTEYLSYKKTNVDEDLKWRPMRNVTMGAGYGFERWNRDNRFTTITNEHTGRVFADARITDSALWRGSYSYSVRRYEGDYEIDVSTWLNSRMFDLANRDRSKARTSLDLNVNQFLTITPIAGLRWDDYPETTPFQAGVKSEHSWHAGIEVGVMPDPNWRFMAGYTYEQSKMDMTAIVADAAGTAAGNACNFPGYPPPDFVPYTAPSTCGWADNLTTTYHTVVASADWKAIPGTLDFRLNYVASWSREAHDFTPCALGSQNCDGTVVAGVTPAQAGLPWPDNTNLYQRFDATARYYFSEDFLRKMGWKGKVVAKLRYTFERNNGSFWQSDSLNAYFGTLTGNTELTGTSRSLWLAYYDPNYTAQIIAASLKFIW